MEFRRLDASGTARAQQLEPIGYEPIMPDGRFAATEDLTSSRLSGSSLFSFGQQYASRDGLTTPSLYDTSIDGVGELSPIRPTRDSLLPPRPESNVPQFDPLDRRLQLAEDPRTTAWKVTPIDEPAEDVSPVVSSLGTVTAADARLSLPPLDQLSAEAYLQQGLGRDPGMPSLTELLGGRDRPTESREPVSLAQLSAMQWEARAEQAAGQDVYQDLLGAYSFLQEQDLPEPGELTPGTPSEAIQPSLGMETSPERMDTLTEEMAGRTDDSSVAGLADREARLRRAQRMAEELMATPVESFAGQSENRANTLISQAEELLQDGEYYRAANRYELAAAAAPENPLPLIGRGHALIAAGDYLSATYWLTRGIGRFEGVLQFDLNLPRLIGNQDLLDRRRADLENILASREDYQLRFLLGYIEYYSGLREIGEENFRRAAATAPKDSLIARFPALLESGREALP
jgi:tetratricopeptide (TPR) repeat protein